LIGGGKKTGKGLSLKWELPRSLESQPQIYLREIVGTGEGLRDSKEVKQGLAIANSVRVRCPTCAQTRIKWRFARYLVKTGLAGKPGAIGKGKGGSLGVA